MIEIKGWLAHDGSSGSVAANPYKDHGCSDSIAQVIAEQAEQSIELKRDLGGQMGIIPEANVQIYYTPDECTFEEAEQMFLEQMDGVSHYSEDGGTLISEYHWIGYSEYTITGLDIDRFELGGHDLEYEIYSHIGEYINMRIS